MELANTFEVSVPIDQAWAILTDIERVAPCMPGMELKEVDGDIYKGVCKVKLGPISQSFEGTAHFLEVNEDLHRVVLKADGRESRGQGSASATVTSVLTPKGDRTSVSIVTDLAITGKAAQFGRGMLADVSTRLLNQFVERLEADVLSHPGDPSPTSVPSTTPTSVAPTAAPEAPAVTGDASASPPATSGRRIISSAPAEPVDLIGVSRAAMARRLVPLFVVLSIVAAIVSAIASSWSGGRWAVLAALVLLALSVALGPSRSGS